MKDRIMLCWRESEKSFRHDAGPSYQETLGFTTGGTYTGAPPTALIQFNTKLIFCSPTPAHNGVRKAFGTLLHECVNGGSPMSGILHSGSRY